MIIHNAKYVASFPKIELCPKTDLPEYAFIGRSNVGKSSLINMLTGRKEIARTSKTPGKTQMINYFLVNENWHLVDLPGYGYAKVSKKHRDSLARMIENYILKRPNLQCIFVLIDSNVPAQKVDIEFINNLGQMRRPFVMVYTKTDRLKKQNQLDKNLKIIRDNYLEYWNELPQQFITSSVNGLGREEVLAFINNINSLVSKE